MTYDATKIQVPDYEYSADYYPSIVARLRRLNRTRVPEITNEDERELFIQIERAFGLMAHYNNTLLDLVANSMFLSTGKIPAIVKSVLQLIGSDLLPANPAQVDMLATLSSRYAVPVRLLEAFRKFATKRTPDYPEIIFENATAFDLTARTDDQALIYGYGMVLSTFSTGTTSVSSIEPDILYDSSSPFAAGHVGNYIRVYDSVLGNDLDQRRVLEFIDADHVRLENASFLSEDNISWAMYELSTNCAPDWSIGVVHDPWSGGTVYDGDAIYIGHPDILWNRIDVTLDPLSASAGYKTVWEFYDPLENSTHPGSVASDTPAPGQMAFSLTDLLGSNDVTGALVEVEYIPTGARYRTYSLWGGAPAFNYIVVEGYLGQSVPSTAISDYIVKCAWRALPDIDDHTQTVPSSLAKDGRIDFTVPRTQDDSWYRYRLYDSTTATINMAFFLRLRIVDAVGMTAILPSSIRIDRGSEYILMRLVQGRTVEETNLSSNGQVNQTIQLRRKPYILLSARVFVTEGATEYEWEVGSSFLRSRSTSRHCVVDPQTDGTAILKFGDGVAGKVPPIGTNNIRVVYRVGAEENGNIGANTLTVNRDGAGPFNAITNPRAGRYWLEADWTSQLALETAKRRAPAVLQTMQRSVAPSDVTALATAFRTLSGSRIVARAKAYEESFGPKTIELVVVGWGGAALSDDEKTELEEYFNGGDVYGYDGINLFNSRIVVTNYIPRPIAINIRVECYPVITETIVRRALTTFLAPTAVEPSGVNFVWRFGQSVALSRITSEIFALSRGNIFDVDITSPSTDFALVNRELPMFDPTGSNVTIISPTFEE